MRNRMILNFCLLAGILAIPGIAAGAQRGLPPDRATRPRPIEAASISGRIMLKTGIPFTGRVTITLSSIAIPSSTIHTDGGGFSFVGLREGNYTIEVTGDPDRYLPVYQHVHLTRGGRSYLSIVMVEKQNPVNKNPVGNVVSLAELDQKVPSAARREVEKAVKLIEEGEHRLAISHYKQAIALYPEYLLARNDLGVLYLQLRLPDQAAEQFEAALDIDPNSFNARLNLGIALIEKRTYLKAIEEINEALSINSAHPAGYLYLGIAHFEAEQLPAAKTELSKALSMGGASCALAHYYIALVHIKSGQEVDARRELRAYLEAAPEGTEAENARSLLERLK